GLLARASRPCAAARGLLRAGPPARGEALTLSAGILQANGKLDEARERFAQVRQDFKEAPCLAPALLGLAECQAALGEDEESISTYGELIALLKEAAKQRDVTVATAAASLMERHADRFARGDYRAALRYAAVAERAYRGTGGEVPPAVMLALGASSRRVAEQILSEARNSERGVLTIDQVSPVTAAEAKKHLLDAGGAYREHARAVVVTDNVAYGESLWLAGDCFDQAGDRESAREAFRSYVDGASDDDPRRPEAKFRLAQVLQAQRQWTGAEGLYRELVEARNRAGAAASAGIWADRALVPLARCLLADDTKGNDDEAESLLQSVVDGTMLAPDSLEYRDAVTELGELYHATGRYAEAIARLGESLRRHPDGPRAVIVQYKLADANRLSADRIARDLTESRPAAEREQLAEARGQRLREAMKLYEQVQQRLAAKDRRKTTELDRLVQRNSAFAVADCAYDLGDMAAAIRQYDAAAQRYAGDPASLVAMVQIVNAYVAQGKWAEAMTAHDRAQRQLASLPENVWNSPDLPMERKHWERWLESSSLLEQRRRARAGVE
ncbi:MAG: tetratricopeptide repeat protein, partial [Phycisphaerae bacterium]|nr:tetratricopeptide repeat protein [Phycisphaerae bacterium]